MYHVFLQCEDQRCQVWQHLNCVLIPDKPGESAEVPPVFYCELCRLSRADPYVFLLFDFSLGGVKQVNLWWKPLHFLKKNQNKNIFREGDSTCSCNSMCKLDFACEI